MSTSQVNSTTNDYSLPTTTRTPSQTLDKDAFLQLFVEQLKNQDPTSPMDTNASISQMAQFSMVEQLTNLAQTQQMAEGTGMLGHQVTVTDASGDVSGKVEKVALVNNAVQVFINGTGYGIDQVTEIT